MSFDRSSAADEAPDNQRPTDQPRVEPPDAPRSEELAHARLPTRDERIAAYWQTRAAVDREYAAWDGRGESQADGSTQADGNQIQGAAAPENTSDTGESVSGKTGALRQRVADLEAGSADRDQQLAAADTKLADQDQVIAELRSTRAEQDKRIASLEADLGRIAASVSELRDQRGEQQPSTEIENRAGGGQTERAERAEPQHDLRLPSDAVNNVISLIAGGTITELAYHLRELPPEYAGIGATGLALGAGIVAVWRECRKAKHDANH
jgi:uncharacterized coiled-coil protein SlyX